MKPGTTDTNVEKMQERMRLMLAMPGLYLDEYHATVRDLLAEFVRVEEKARAQYERDHDIAAYEAVVMPVVKEYDKRTQAALKHAVDRYAKFIEKEHPQ